MWHKSANISFVHVHIYYCSPHFEVDIPEELLYMVKLSLWLLDIQSYWYRVIMYNVMFI